MQEIIDQLVAGEFELDCPRMKLRKASGEKRELSGAGSVRQDRAGRLTFRLYTDDPDASTFDEDLPRSEGPRLIPPEELYGLEAVDADGVTWTATGLFFDRAIHRGTGWTTFIGELPAFRSEQVVGWELDVAYVRAYFVGDFEIPSNVVTRTVTEVRGRKVKKLTSRNRAEWEAGAWKMQVAVEKGYLELSAGHDGTFVPPHVLARITEALEFVLGRPLQWSLMEVSSAGQLVREVRGGTNGRRGGLFPPIQLRTEHGERCWKLFSAFSNHVVGYDEHGRHPVARWTRSVVAARDAPLETQVLALCVAVEGILTTAAYANAGTPKPSFISELDTAVVAIRQASISEGTRARLEGVIGMLRTANAKEKLGVLVKDGLVSMEEVEAWSRWRNSLSHGRDRRLDNQVLLERLQAQVLFHRLVCAAVGYDGEIGDYGKFGIPLTSNRYRPR